MRHLWWIGLVAVAGLGCKKKTEPVAPIEGWHTEEGWKGSCYYPKNYAQLGVGDRKIYRQTVLEQMMSQWKGAREDGVSMNEDIVLNTETALFGKPDWIESVSMENLEQCKAYMTGGSLGAWSSWLSGVAGRINEGDCTSPPLTYTLFDYLDIGKGWQIPAGVCEGDQIRVSGTSIDYYRLTDGGPWINVAGDTSQAAIGDDYPCNIEGCYVGTLVMKFVDYQGIETIMPVGQELVWTAPNHGEISVRINDNSFFDNKYKQEGSMIHHTGITYAPAN